MTDEPWWWAEFQERDWIAYLRAKSHYDRRTGCWVWDGEVNKKTGYGTVYVRIDGWTKKFTAHTVAWLAHTGRRVVPGMHLDHVYDKGCRSRACWNPKHLEEVTPAQNNQRAWERNRAGECPKGHPFDDENTGVNRGWRYCKKCNRERVGQWQRDNPEKKRVNQRRYDRRRRGKVDA